MLGSSCSSRRKAGRPIRATVISPSAMIVADRGRPSSRASSPKNSAGPKLRLLAFRVIIAAPPSRIT